MKPKHKTDIDRAFGRTMMWVCLCMVVIFLIAYVSNCIHSEDNSRPRGADRELKTLTNSIHEFEDGF